MQSMPIRITGLELRGDFREMLIGQSKDFKAGKLATVSLDEVLADLAIDRFEIEAKENVPVAVP